MEKISVMIVEDHEVTRLGLRKLLEELPNISVISEVGDGRTAVTKATETEPDLILMDIGLPGIDGIQATKLIKQSCKSKVILITSHEQECDIFAGLTAGADAYCLKGVSGNQLFNAVRSVLDGAIWLDPTIAPHVIGAVACRSMAPRTRGNHQGTSMKLSDREYQVLTLLVEGLSNQQMAQRLYLSQETIKTHMRHIMEKLQVTDRTQAAIKAVTQGLVNEYGKVVGTTAESCRSDFVR